MVGQYSYAYADESGDPGYQFSANSSPRFVVGIVLPEHPEESNIRWAGRVAGRPEQSFHDIRLLNSIHPLIQCSDMITGAVAEHVNRGEAQWFDAIAPQIAVLWHERFAHNEEKRNSPDLPFQASHP
jgi:hypothetical protein